MAYNEHIYIQEMGKDKTGKEYPVYDLVEEWGLYGMEIPFTIAGETKELYSNDWHDEDGDDEYVPGRLMMKAYDMKMKLAFKGKNGEVNENIRDFMSYLRGERNDVALFRLYSTYTGIGRQNVRLVSIDDDAEFKRTGDYDLLIVTVTMKVNDPDTDIVLSKEHH